MQTTTILDRPKERVQRTHEAIEQAILAQRRGRPRRPLGTCAVLVGEQRGKSIPHPMSRQELVEHLLKQAQATRDPETCLRLCSVADAVHTTSPELAPIVIACVEGQVVLQFVAEDPS